MKPLLLGRLKNHLYYVEEILTLATPIMFMQLRQHNPMPITALKNKRIGYPTTCVQNKTSSNIDNIELWHLRLGHIPFNRLHVIFPNLQCNMFDKKFLCTICPLGKQTRKAFL